MQSDKYWALRALQREQESYDGTTDSINRLHSIYYNAAERLAKMAEYIFDRFSRSSGGMIDPAKARKLLTEAESAEVMEKLRREYAKTVSPEALTCLNAPAYAYRISRVQAMRRAVDAEVQNLAEMETQIGAPHLAKTYDEAYYKTLYDRAKEPEGIPSSEPTTPDASASIKGPTFDRLSDRTIQQALENRWHGENYSERVWKNTHVVAKAAGRVIDAGVAAGTSVANMSTEIKNLFGVAYYAAERLVRTETSRMHNDATLRGYKTMGVEQYTWLGTLDARTCKLCGALDGKHFKLSEAITGKTLPPRHPNCRCTTIAYYSGEASGSTRTARNPETGRNYKVPAGMTYEQWHTDIEKQHSAGCSEYEQIKKSGIRRAPDIDTFQKQRYNNSPEYQKLMQRLANVQGKGEWKAVEFNPQTSGDHFERHGADVGAKDVTEYQTATLKFVNDTPGKETVIASDGVRRFYLPATNEFASAYPDGTISSYYKPRQGAKYWERQVKNYGSKEK